MDPKVVVRRAFGWVRQNPRELVTALRNAAGLRVTVPLDALRWASEQATGRRAPKDIEILSVPPGVRVSATVDVMKTPLRAGATVFIEAVRASPAELRLEVRLRDIELTVLGPSDSPIATLIQSGALDLSKPGKLLKFLPKRPPLIVESDDDLIVIDLLREPRIADRARKVAAMLTPLVTVRAVEAAGDHLGIQLTCLPDGLSSAVDSIRAAM